jgi:demethylmenaquinone methyltransferase/2-methoxy-6-polyprenyl-1,4-benzoquinol methylase
MSPVIRSQTPSNEQNISAMFNRIAPRYDLLNALLSMRQDRRWRRQLIASIPHRPGGTMLDVATGTGDILLSAMTTHKEYGRFIGVDIAENMLVIARSKAHRQIATRAAEWQVMSAERLDYAAGSVDCISIAFGMRNVINKPVALAEFYRVLKPGGKALILEFFKPPSSIFARLFRFYFHNILPLIGGLLSDKQAYRYLPESVEGFQKVEDFCEAGRDCGFILQRCSNFLFGSCSLVEFVKPEDVGQ